MASRRLSASPRSVLAFLWAEGYLPLPGWLEPVAVAVLLTFLAATFLGPVVVLLCATVLWLWRWWRAPSPPRWHW